MEKGKKGKIKIEVGGGGEREREIDRELLRYMWRNSGNF